jgi:hypothetical protein
MLFFIKQMPIKQLADQSARLNLVLSSQVIFQTHMLKWYLIHEMKFHLVEVLLEEPINGYQARIHLHWLWIEDWEKPISLMPFCQSVKSIKTPPNRILFTHTFL